MRRVLILALLLGGMRLILPLGSAGRGSQALLAFGFLVLAAYTVGEFAAMLRQPKLVGYLAAGILFGPSLLDVVGDVAIARLAPVNGLAIALIAFLAGVELRWADIKERGVLILQMMSAELLLAFAGMATVMYLMHDMLPFLRAAPPREILAFAILFAAAAIVHSPSVTMAVLSETGARGPVARTTLGIVLLADVTVLLFFSGALAVARSLAPPTSGAAISMGLIAWEIGGAILVGALLGGIVALYLRFVERDLMIFAILMTFFGAEIASLLHVEILLTLLVAGFVTENTSRGRGDALRHAMERSADPVFVVFFALAGAKIDVRGLAELWPLVIPIVLVRAGAIFAGTQLGARWGGAGEAERKYSWMGLVSQAGVAIGLATVITDAYPERGEQIRALLLAVIAVNTVVGAVLFRRALSRSGELDTGETAPHSNRVPVQASPIH